MKILNKNVFENAHSFFAPWLCQKRSHTDTAKGMGTSKPSKAASQSPTPAITLSESSQSGSTKSQNYILSHIPHLSSSLPLTAGALPLKGCIALSNSSSLLCSSNLSQICPPSMSSKRKVCLSKHTSAYVVLQVRRCSRGAKLLNPLSQIFL